MKSDAEKKAYAREYYQKYRKKGLKKGRKKGTKKPKTVSLIGVGGSGLNDEGRIQAALIKERLKTEMNAALVKETDPAKREAIRVEYSRKAQQQMNALKSDPKYAKPTKEKTTKEKTAKSSGGKASKEKASGGTSEKTGGGTKSSTQKAAKSSTKKQNLTNIKTRVSDLSTLIRSGNLTPTQKTIIRKRLQEMLDRLTTIKG